MPPLRYKITKNCPNCKEFSVRDWVPFEHGAVYSVGCRNCRISYQFYAGLYEVGESQKYSYDHGVYIRLTRVR